MLEAPLTGVRGRRFKPAVWATLATVAGISLTIALGFWQLGRADYKRALQTRIADFARQPPVNISQHEFRLEDILLRRVEVRGRFEPHHAVFLDNRVHAHQAGFHVIMPLRMAGDSKYVLVNRGWIAAGRERTRVPEVKTPEGEVVVRGLAVAPTERFIELSSKVAEGNIWQNLVIERYRQATKLDVQPFILQQDEPADDGLVRDWPAVDLKRNMHLAYAVQWFALAAMILIYYVVINVRRRKPETT
jgi:surfeit locus 1 family protein